MILHLNLIPALAYALVTLFCNITGIKVPDEKNSGKQQVISHQVQPRETWDAATYVVASNIGQLMQKSGMGNSGLVWKIPYAQPVKL
jgi:hypothetical protein